LPGDVKAIVSKEIKMFFRDQAQWSQLFLIGALILVYTYNFAALPLDKSPIQTIYLQNLLGFFNMGLALFVLTAVTARFAYPAVSTEREAFWLILSAPTTLHRFLWVKFFVYCLPLMAFTEILVIVTNWLLQVSAFMMWLSAFSVFAMVPGVVALGVGIGAAFPDFKAENPAQSVTGYGGALYMILSAVFIGMVIAIQAGPVYAVFMADLKDQSLNIWQQAWIWGSIFLSLAICSGALYFPMAFGVRRLSELRA
jgi:ABC-2 type transport system permease protein